MKVEFITARHKLGWIRRNRWRHDEPFVARVTCDEWPEPILVVIPGDYETDLESVPRLLFVAYVLIKGRFSRGASLHDYLLDLIQGELDDRLRTSLLPFVPSREWIDRLFYAAMTAEIDLPDRNRTRALDILARETAYMGVTAYTAFLKGAKP